MLLNETQAALFLLGLLCMGPAIYMMRWVYPDRVKWRVAIPLTVVYIAMAVGCCSLFDWQDMPWWAYIDVVPYFSMACTAFFAALAKQLGAYQKKPGHPSGTEARRDCDSATK